MFPMALFDSQGICRLSLLRLAVSATGVSYFPGLHWTQISTRSTVTLAFLIEERVKKLADIVSDEIWEKHILLSCGAIDLDLRFEVAT